MHLGLLGLQLRELHFSSVESLALHQIHPVLSIGRRLQRDHGAPCKVGNELLIILAGSGQQLAGLHRDLLLLRLLLVGGGILRLDVQAHIHLLPSLAFVTALDGHFFSNAHHVQAVTDKGDGCGAIINRFGNGALFLVSGEIQFRW